MVREICDIEGLCWHRTELCFKVLYMEKRETHIHTLADMRTHARAHTTDRQCVCTSHHVGDVIFTTPVVSGQCHSELKALFKLEARGPSKNYYKKICGYYHPYYICRNICWYLPWLHCWRFQKQQQISSTYKDSSFTTNNNCSIFPTVIFKRSLILKQLREEAQS